MSDPDEVYLDVEVQLEHSEVLEVVIEHEAEVTADNELSANVLVNTDIMKDVEV